MNEQELIDALIKQDASDDEIVEAVKLARTEGKISDSPGNQSAEQPQKESYLSSLGKDIAPNLAATMAAPDKNYWKQSLVNVPLATLADVSTLPRRGAAAFSGQDMSDPNARPFRGTQESLAQKGPAGQAASGVVEALTDPMTGFGIGAGAKIMGKVFPKVGAEVAAFAKKTGPKVTGGISISEGMKNLGTRIQNTPLKIMAKEAREGAKIENVAKYDLWGSPKQIHEKAQQQINQAGNELREIIGDAAKLPENQIDLPAAYDRAYKKISSGENIDKVTKSKLQNALLDIYSEHIEVYGGEPVDLVEAQLLKRSVGKQGDWLASPNGGMMVDKDASIKSQAYDLVYDELKTELEQKGGPRVKALNKKMSELIPLERAAGKRMLVASRNNPISLTDYIGGLATLGSAASGNFAPAGLLALNIASKSAKVGEGLYKSGSAIQKIPEPVRTGVKLGTAGAGIGAAVAPEGERGKGAAIGTAAGFAAPFAVKGAIGAKKILGNERGSIGGVENPQIHTDNFKNWFGDWKKSPEKASKVVDESGKPVIVYHGTGDTFNRIDFKKGSQGVFWFSSSKKSIEDGLSGANKTTKIMPLYADIKNPAGWEEYDKYSIAELAQKGYDGVILKNKDGSFDGFVINKPNQIKSATGNSGAFNPANTDIRGSAALPMLGLAGAAAGSVLTAAELAKRKKAGFEDFGRAKLGRR